MSVRVHRLLPPITPTNTILNIAVPLIVPAHGTIDVAHAIEHGASSFNQQLNNWNVSNVTDMAYMFMHANSFNQPLNAPWYHDEESDSE